MKVPTTELHAIYAQQPAWKECLRDCVCCEEVSEVGEDAGREEEIITAVIFGNKAK